VRPGSGSRDVACNADGSVWFCGQRDGTLNLLDPRDGGLKVVNLGPGAAPHHVDRGDPMREEIRHIQAQMEGAAYITDPAISTAVHLATTLRKPLLVEGHAGVGKTLLAIAAGNLRRDADRTLQCVRDPDRFSAAEAILYLPVIQSGPAAAPAP
jgi:hypothetical protein